MTLFREFMWINMDEGCIAFDVKNMSTNSHEYYEYLKFYNKDVSDGNKEIMTEDDYAASLEITLML